MGSLTVREVTYTGSCVQLKGSLTLEAVYSYRGHLHWELLLLEGSLTLGVVTGRVVTYSGSCVQLEGSLTQEAVTVRGVN
jgi:hypothetical protein